MEQGKVKSLCRNLEGVSNTISISINLWNTLIAPVIIAVLLNEVFDATKKDEDISYSVLAMAAISFIVHIFCGFMNHKINKNHSMLVEYQEQQSALKEVVLNYNALRQLHIEGVSCHTAQVAALRYATEALDGAIGNLANLETEAEGKPTIDIKVLQETFKSFIWPLVVYRESLFGERSGEMWNYSIYLHNMNNDVLWPIARHMDARIEAKNREWLPGFGTVGLSFLHNEIKLIPDLEKYNPSSASAQDDIEKYRCIIALPIQACDDFGSNKEKPQGVLVLTSNHPDCYDLNRDTSFLLALTKVISIYLEKLISTDPIIAQPTNKEAQHENNT